jgi:hypothetical protein
MEAVMANTTSALPANEAVAVSKLTLSAQAVADIFGRTTLWVAAADKADKAAVGLIDTLVAAKVLPDHLRAETGDAEFMRGMSVAIVAAFPAKAQALLSYTDKLPPGDWDKEKPFQYNNATKRTWQQRIGGRMGDIRNGLAARYVAMAAAKAAADQAAILKAQAEKTAAADKAAAKAAEAEAEAKVKAAKAADKALKAKATDQVALAQAAKAAADQAAAETALKEVAAKAAADAKAAEDKLKAEAVARAEAQVATGLRDSLVAIWTKQKQQVQAAKAPLFEAAKVTKALDDLIALVMVVRK